MNPVSEVQQWLLMSELHGVIVPSTDEFLSEFSPPANRRLNWLTGFRGSTGFAVVTREAAALFLDGRYVLQGTVEIASESIEVLPATLPSRRAWLRRTLYTDQRLGLDPTLHAPFEVAQWRTFATEVGFVLELLDGHPIDALWRTGRPLPHRPEVVEYPVRYAGEPYEAKCAALAAYLCGNGWHAFFISDPEDVSWLLNVRATDGSMRASVGDWPAVPSCTSRAIVFADGSVTWFVDADRLSDEVLARRDGFCRIVTPATLSDSLREVRRAGRVAADLRRTPAALCQTVDGSSEWVPDDKVARRRWRKCSVEVESARNVHLVDSTVVVQFMAWVVRAVGEGTVTEFQAAEQLESLRGVQSGYKGPSMPLMSASGPNGAYPHYVPQREGSRALNAHPIYWMDSGGQYAGGSTDNTITLALGVPESKHILAHTYVLKGFLGVAMCRVPVGTQAFQLDALARHSLWQRGMDFAHATGHGVGNCLNIHEGPLIGREPGPLSSVALETGMIISNEPAYYAADDFGLRIESHMVVVASAQAGFLEFDTISRLPIDPRLVDFTLLTANERAWLADYHGKVYRDLKHLLDDQTVAWLASWVRVYTQALSTAVPLDD